MTITRGAIYEVNLGLADGTSIQKGVRPVVVVQNDAGNRHSPVTIVCPLTTRNKKPLPTHLSLTPADCGIARDSTVLCEQPIIISKDQLMKQIGTIKNMEKIKELNRALSVSLGLQ